MDQFEKVCKGLNCHVNGHPHTRCYKCPYWGTGPHGSSECSALAVDALALIRQQEERIKELEAWSKWISVKDRLPESAPDEYLVVNGGKVQLATFIDGMWITPHRVSSITHWMPLPEPPKEET